jgi:uncharacterized membrane protein
LSKKILVSLSEWICKVKPVNFFVFNAIFFGLLFLFVTPPFQGADEPVHFLRAYQISEGNFVIDKHGNRAGGNLPKSLDDTVNLLATHPRIEFMANKKYNIYKTTKAFSYKLNPNIKKQQDFSATSIYTPISYVASSSAIFIGRILDFPPVLLLYMGRFADLIAWIILISIAIYLMPRKKWAMVFVGLLPMTLFQATTLNSDVMSIGLAAVFITAVLRIRQSPKNYIDINRLLLLFVLAIFMVLSKQIMFVLLPLIFLIPSSNFKLNWSYLYKSLIILGPIVILAAWMYLIRGIDVTGSFTNHQNPTEQVLFVAHSPHSFINVLWNTYFFSWGDGITRSFVGTFGWSDAPLSELIVTVAYIAFFLLLSANYDNYRTWLTKNQKLFIFIIGAAYWLIVSAALYIYYSPVEFKIIFGLQGRYFVPLAVLAIPLLYSNWLHITKPAYRIIAVFTPMVLLLTSLITLYVRYYVNNV